MRHLIISLLTGLIVLTGCSKETTSDPAPTEEKPAAAELNADQSPHVLETIIRDAKRIPVSDNWFEVLKLPNGVYAFWEPGHADAVNSFLITGSSRHVLYDTGLGFSSIGKAVEEVMGLEQLPTLPLMVVNSHNHLDHNGGNRDFPQVWIMDDPWGMQRLTTGITGDARTAFHAYWDDFKDHPGVRRPEGFDPTAFEIPPYPKENINLLKDGDTVDLGNRSFRVVHTQSHTPDGLALYDETNKVFFGGDVFLGDRFLVLDLDRLASDLDRVQNLATEWHYSSHGPQLIEAMQQGRHLSVIRRMQGGEHNSGTTTFAGVELPLLSLDGVYVTLADELLVY